MTQEQVSPDSLLPCPFCHGQPQLQHGHADITYVLCEGCGLVASFRPTLKGTETIAAWNKRALH